MGLDMYLRGEKFFWTDWQNDANNRKEDGLRVCELTVELGYWRKHPNLHGFIVNTFAGGKDDCQNIELTVDDLHLIIKTVKEKKLPFTEGFFFGKSNEDEKQMYADLDQLMKVLEWLEVQEPHVSRNVYYRASW